MIPMVAALVLPDITVPVRAAATIYVRAGFAPVPVYGVRGSACTCGQPDCSAVGKHPVGTGWQRRAAADVDVTRELFSEHDGNIGIVVGPEHVVFDIDLYAGGAEGLADLGSMPATLTSRSGSGQGEHRIFVYAQGQDPSEVTNRKVATGVDIKTRTGQIVVAPSLHRSGGHYEWIDCSPPAPLPDSLYERIRRKRVVPLRAVRSSNSGDLLRKRAGAYLAKLAPAISGQGGHAATFAAARACWGWVSKGLGESEGWELLVAYNNRCEPPWTEAELRHKWQSAQDAEHIPSPADREPPTPPSGGGGAAPPSSDPDWRSRLLMTKTKFGTKPAKHHENAVVVLRYHPAWVIDGRPRLRFDQHGQRTLVLEPPWHDSDAPDESLGGGLREWTDADDARLSSWICREVTGLGLSVTDCFRAVRIVAEANLAHPFREYLEGLQWDGVERLPHWLIDHLEVPDSPYARLVGSWWLISASARIYQPGCKVDHVLILEGPQGAGKSSALRALAGDAWFRDTPLDLRSKDAFSGLRGKVIVELAELESLRKADADRAKAFFTSQTDDFRAPYERREVSVPRQCVFAGTVNHASYLTDDTGGRRYWPVKCGAVNVDGVRAARDQLWAEAAHRFKAGERWWPQGAEIDLCTEEQAPRSQVDSWEDAVRQYIAGRDQVTVTDVLANALKLAIGDHDRGVQMRVSSLLAGLGWSRARQSIPGGRQWAYLPPVPTGGA